MGGVPQIRIRACNGAPVRPPECYVLYWMIAARRLTHNFALDRALEYCRELDKPLVVFEALRCSYPWASDRFHSFILDGMADNARVCASRGIAYHPYIEPAKGAARGLLAALSGDACVVVTDDYPCFFLPQMVAAAGTKLAVRLEAVDSNGLLPLRAAQQAFPTAYVFRRFLQKTLPSHLAEFPQANPLAEHSLPAASISPSILSRWPAATSALLAGKRRAVAALPIDHSVAPTRLRGGPESARAHMKRFFAERFPAYAEQRNDPDRDNASGLSPYLHFGHLSAPEIFGEVARSERWTPAKLALRANGGREGWWNMSANAESFLDEVITWREIGYNFCAHRSDYAKFESLPDWAQQTLKKHSRDPRPNVYALEQLESTSTHDPLWNAAQTQLAREGRIHNYLRMLWGKKILEWSRTPQEALAALVHLNNKYALDGRDPNSYSGIFWCLGRYDRPWGPERPIFGTVRYMSSENTARKFSLKRYVEKYSPVAPSSLPLLK